MKDIVYLFKEEPAAWQELRYSLRSLCNLSFPVRVNIVSESIPHWLKNVRHIPWSFEGSRYEDVSRKIELAFRTYDLSKEVIFMYDDQYFISEVDQIDLSVLYATADYTNTKNYFHPDATSAGRWRDLFTLTIDYLKDQGFDKVYGFETHLPRMVNKMETLWYLKKHPVIKDHLQRWTVIGNERAKSGTPVEFLDPRKGIKAGFYGVDNSRSFGSASLEQVLEACRGKKILNHDDEGLTPHLKRYLELKFPNKSIYEK